jgi:hypothetical protein
MPPGGEQVTAPYGKDQVKAVSPDQAHRTISQTEEAELYRHYGGEYGESRSGSGLLETTPTGPTASRASAKAADG